jgi:hypothetical protein
VIQLPSILLKKLQANARLGRFYASVNENTYGFMLSKILLAAFNQNLSDDEIHRMYMVHCRLNLVKDDLDEWMRCLEESLVEIGLNASIRGNLVSKVRMIGTHLLLRKSESGGEAAGVGASAMVDELIHDIDDAGGCCYGRDLIERLRNIRDSL